MARGPSDVCSILMPFYSRITPALLGGRYSQTGARYFVTWCTGHRMPYFLDAAARDGALHEIVSSFSRGDSHSLATCIMPDHIHLVLELGERLALGPLLGKIKSNLSRQFYGVTWQRNSFDHLIRDADASERFAFYCFMNPHTAGLCGMNETWSGWKGSAAFRWRFEEKLRDGRFPHPEWLQESEAIRRTLPAGAD